MQKNISNLKRIAVFLLFYTVFKGIFCNSYAFLPSAERRRNGVLMPEFVDSAGFVGVFLTLQIPPLRPLKRTGL